MYTMIMLVAGLGIPTMATLNSRLGIKLESAVLATTILFAIAFFVSLFILIFAEGFPKAIYRPVIPWYFYCGGMLVAFYVLNVTWVAPRFGVANAIAFVLLGQLIAMSTIDHFGLFGTTKYLLSIQRLCGLIVMAIGVFLVVKHVPSS